MIKSLFLFSFYHLLMIGSSSICPERSSFPDWMMGYFHAQFADGSSANGTFRLWYANVTFSTGENGTLTMTEPLQQVQQFYIFHECVQIYGIEPEHRCSLLVRNGDNGYTEYIHKDPSLISKCPQSLDSPGLETEIVTRMK